MMAENFAISTKRLGRNTGDITRKEKDEHLWSKFRSGSMSAYADIYATYFQDLYQYGLKVAGCEDTVKDAIHDLFVKLWNRRETIGPTNNIRFYLLASLRNILLDQFGKDNRELPGVINTANLINLQRPSYEEELVDKQLVIEKEGEVLRALDSLTSRERETVVLKYFRGKKNLEIAEQMQISVEAVYNHIYKALKTLRKVIRIPTMQ